MKDIVQAIEAELDKTRKDLQRFQGAVSHLEEKIEALEEAREALDWDEPGAEVQKTLEQAAGAEPAAAPASNESPKGVDAWAPSKPVYAADHHGTHTEFVMSVIKATPGKDWTVRQLVDIANNGPGPNRAVTSIGSTLKRLVDKGEVQRRDEGNKVFYSV